MPPQPFLPPTMLCSSARATAAACASEQEGPSRSPQSPLLRAPLRWQSPAVFFNRITWINAQ